MTRVVYRVGHIFAGVSIYTSAHISDYIDSLLSKVTRTREPNV